MRHDWSFGLRPPETTEVSTPAPTASSSRPAGSPAGDQKRIATPAKALRAGSEHIVVARPDWTAPDTSTAARAILAELAAA